jgi:choline dehydrogenase
LYVEELTYTFQSGRSPSHIHCADQNFDFNPSPASIDENATFRAWADEVWAANGTGPYSLAGGNAAAWLPFRVVSPRYEEIAANLSSQDHAVHLPAGTHPTVVAGYRAQMMAMADSLRGNKTSFFYISLGGRPTSGITVNLHTLSRGSVNIDPVDPEGREPVVDYRAMSNPLDGIIMADMLRYARRYYLQNPATTRYQAIEVSPGTNVTSDSDLVAYVADTMRPSLYHPSGTCAMLPKELGGVVDEQLRVYSVRNLRIVDASIMPMVVGGNTCQPVYAIAEKVRTPITNSEISIANILFRQQISLKE